MEDSTIYLLGCLFLFTLTCVIKFLMKTWWTPIRLQSAMRLQGIKGPSYRFLHGNTKEITKMRIEVTSSPMELSHHMFSRIEPHVYSWSKQYGMNFLTWYGPRAHLVVTETELVKEVLNNKDGTYTKAVIQSYADKFLGDGLVASQGEKWCKMRKLANYAFHGESLKRMTLEMIASVEAMIERWRQDGAKEIEVYHEFKLLTAEIISRTAFGSSYLEGQHIFEMMGRMAHIVGRNNYKVKIPGMKNFWRTSDDIESDQLQERIRDVIMKMIKKREDDVAGDQEDSYGTDFLGLLVKAHHENDKAKQITLDDLVDECKTFYVAGHETTTSSLTWTILLLAIHRDWQERVREEVLELFGSANPSPDGIGRLKTMSMVINESLRMYPSVFNLTREVQREVRLGKALVPAKTTLSLPILAPHSNEQIWGADVHLFRPERFADFGARAARENKAEYLPFGLGPRSCVGMNFAVAEMKIALSMILQRYSLSLSPSYVHSPIHIITIRPKHGLQIIFQAM